MFDQAGRPDGYLKDGSIIDLKTTKISIQNDTDMRHYSFVRDSKIPRGSFATDWSDLGHKLAPIVVCGGLILVLLVLAATT